MSKHCEGAATGVYRHGNTFALRGGGRRVSRLLRALTVVACLLLPVAAMAQPAAAPSEQPATPSAADAPSDANAASDASANMKADLAAAREQQRTTAATRQQIQAIRAALRARLAAMHR
jgi:hypothetical protein